MDVGLSVTVEASYASPDYENKKREFYSYYGENERRLVDAARALENLVRLLLSSEAIEGVKIIGRVKNKHECITKFDVKYRQGLEKSGLDYVIKDEITDLVGLRVVCLYESQISSVSSVIKNHFYVVKEENKSIDLYENLRFGYKGVHLDLSLSENRRALPEYKDFQDIRFELQIRSIVQDAWSEVDHRLKYKKQIPDALKRRIIRLAALFELADQEFEEIRKTTDEIESIIKQKIQSNSDSFISDDGNPLDSFSFLEFATRRYPKYVFESYKVDGFVDDIKQSSPSISIGEFKNIFNESYDVTQRYRSQLKENGEVNINPYTHMRHMLVLHDSEKYGDLLYPRQRDAFLAWVRQDGL